ncbi:MAG TPA: BlaI/MecI/CopY family transcriptional regulator [Acidimicrobiales bacterium]
MPTPISRKVPLDRKSNQEVAMRGERLPMGALESAVMEVLWADGGWLIPAEVHAKLPAERNLHYTTVMTTLGRLQKKGRLDRRKDGRAFAYHPTLTRAEWAATRMDEVLNVTVDRNAALAHFLDRLGDADRSQLRRILSEREKT